MQTSRIRHSALICLSFVTFSFPAWAQSPSDSLPSATNLPVPQASPASATVHPGEVRFLIDKDLFQFFPEIQVKSASLALGERMDLFVDMKQNAFGPVSLNLTLGFGSGSFLQGDWLTGLALMMVDCLAVTYEMYLSSSTVTLSNARSTGSSTSVLQETAKQNPMALIPPAIMSLNRLTGGILAFMYTENYNHQLEKALLIPSMDKNSLVSWRMDF